MTIVSCENITLENGFIGCGLQEVMERLKGKFNREEAYALIATFNSLIYKENNGENNIALLSLVNGALEYGETMYIKVDNDTIINKLTGLSNQEAKAVIQMTFECIKGGQGFNIDESISENFGIDGRRWTLIRVW